MTRKISGHDGELVVNDAVELDGHVTGGLVIEPGGSAVIRRSLVVDGNNDDSGSNDRDRHGLDGDLGSVISDIP